MREILFRGKCFNTEEWVEGYLGIEVPDELVIQQFSYDEYFKSNCIDQYSVKPETVGQFTGLTDKNGKKIFEGDILSTSKWKGVVTWGDGYGGYCVQHGINRPAIDIVMNEFDVEVIGNIYDNPELMGGNTHG